MTLMMKSQEGQTFYIRNHHAVAFITIPVRGCEHAKNGPQLALMKPWNFQALRKRN